jgi:hypothetical protein
MNELTKEQKVELNEYLEELIGKYVEYKEQENHFKNLCKEISNDVDETLHAIEQNSIKVYISAIDKTYEAKYVDRKSKKVDYVKLAEIISDEMYDYVMTESEVTYLQIRKAAMTKNTKREKPVKEKKNNNLNIPTGTFK